MSTPESRDLLEDGVSPIQIHQQLGALTRQLHDSLNVLGWRIA